jgi:hypothetical protein
VATATPLQVTALPSPRNSPSNPTSDDTTSEAEDPMQVLHDTYQYALQDMEDIGANPTWPFAYRAYRQVFTALAIAEHYGLVINYRQASVQRPPGSDLMRFETLMRVLGVSFGALRNKMTLYFRVHTFLKWYEAEESRGRRLNQAADDMRRMLTHWTQDEPQEDDWWISGSYAVDTCRKDLNNLMVWLLFFYILSSITQMSFRVFDGSTVHPHGTSMPVLHSALGYL